MNTHPLIQHLSKLSDSELDALATRLFTKGSSPQPIQHRVNESHEEWERITDELAKSSQPGGPIKMTSLAELIGISRDLFFACRTGRYPITKKSWRKLDRYVASLQASGPTTANGAALQPGQQ